MGENKGSKYVTGEPIKAIKLVEEIQKCIKVYVK